MNPLTPMVAAALAADRQREAATGRRASESARAQRATASLPRRLRPGDTLAAIARAAPATYRAPIVRELPPERSGAPGDSTW
jgi:hypothetical protein